MCAKWLKDLQHDLIVDNLDQALIRESNGTGFRFSPEDFFGVFRYISALFTCIQFNKDLPEAEQIGILQDVIFSSAKRNKITSKTLLGEITRKENEYLRRNTEKYVLVTSLSIKYTPKLKPIATSGANIIFSKSLPKKFNRDSITNKAKNLSVEPPTVYTSVRVEVSGRSEREAVSKAIDAIDLIRGIYNLILNTRSMLSFDKPKSPVNEVLLGPSHTLHHPNGALVSNQYWYEPDYVFHSTPTDLDRKWNIFSRSKKGICDRLRRSPLKLLLEDSIRRYTRALDERKLNNSFLQLWSLLEVLTGTTNADYKQTVKKASSFYKEYELNRQILNHLKERRNSFVHRSQSHEDAETILYTLKSYCEKIIFFLLENSRGFKSVEDYLRFLDTPAEIKTIDEQISLLKKSKKLRRDK